MLALIIGAVWYFRAKAPELTVVPQEQTQDNSQQPTQAEKENTNTTFWDGTLKVSDNSQKGNLMLVTADHTVYIHTSRDFSSLIGKRVKVSYTGTLDSFSLGDITGE